MRQVLVACVSLLEIAVIVASKYPTHPLARKILESFVKGPVSLTNRISLSPTFLAGSAIAIASAFIRYQCFSTLGRLFTFEVTIRDNHRLVTSGPYAYVRHPAYTSALGGVIGMGLVCFGVGSWMRECGVLDTVWGKGAAGMYGALFVPSCIVAVKRPLLEDDLLRRQFGSEWNEWAQRVPYRLIPYVW